VDVRGEFEVLGSIHPGHQVAVTELDRRRRPGKPAAYDHYALSSAHRRMIDEAPTDVIADGVDDATGQTTFTRPLGALYPPPGS